MRTRIEHLVAERGPSCPVRGRGERVPPGVGGPIDEGRVVLGAPLGGIQRVVVLVGVLRTGPERLVRLPQGHVHPADDVAHHAVVPGGRERAMGFGIDRKKLGVVLEHLLVMRDLPLPRRRVAEEAALDVVVHTAAGHRAERSMEHRRDLGVAEPPVLVEEEAQKLRLRELRLAPKASELGVVLPAYERPNLIDDLKAEIARLRRTSFVLLLA